MNNLWKALVGDPYQQQRTNIQQSQGLIAYETYIRQVQSEAYKKMNEPVIIEGECIVTEIDNRKLLKDDLSTMSK
jgi:hypothetical protein